MHHSYKPLITPEQLKKQFQTPLKEQQFILNARRIAKNIIKKDNKRFVIMLGPCSIHKKNLAMEYAALLKELEPQVSDAFVLMMRVFLEKPRTKFGWKGFVYDPKLDGSDDIELGLKTSRELLLDIAKLKVPVVTEFLDPFIPTYYEDLVTWGVVGARTSASQIHRQMAAQLDFPFGFKNETDGMIDNAIYSILAAKNSQTVVGINHKGVISSFKAKGNPYTHLILRGSNTTPNYFPSSVAKIDKRQKMLGLDSPLIIDCSHGNSQKDIQKQPTVFKSIYQQIQNNNALVSGAMIESHLKGGNALSLTDPCLDWNSTKNLILEAREAFLSIKGQCVTS